MIPLIVRTQESHDQCNLRNLRIGLMDFRVEGDSVTFWLRVKPRSSRERLTVDGAGELRLELHAAPTEGQANDACADFFHRLLRVPRSSVQIASGGKSRRKLIRIRGAQGVERRVISAAGKASGSVR